MPLEVYMTNKWELKSTRSIPCLLQEQIQILCPEAKPQKMQPIIDFNYILYFKVESAEKTGKQAKLLVSFTVC